MRLHFPRSSGIFAAALFIVTGLAACGGGAGSVPHLAASNAPVAPGAPAAPTPTPTASGTPNPAATQSVTLFNVPAGINHLTFSSDGKLWFTTNNMYGNAPSYVGFLDPATGHSTTFSPQVGSESAYSVPQHITSGANGSVWYDLNWFGAGCSGTCTPASPMINQVTESGISTAYATGMPGRGAVVVVLFLGPDGHIYALGSTPAGQNEEPPAVLQFTVGQTSGPSATYGGPAVQGDGYETLTRGPNGTLVIATDAALYSFASGSFSTIGAIPNGGVCGVASTQGAYWIDQAYFTPNPNGNGETGTWTADILKLSPSGAASTYTMPSSGVVTCSISEQGQDQVVAGLSGMLYYAENNADKLGRLNPLTGASTEISPGIGPTMAVAVDANGNVWVAGIQGKIAEIKGF